MKTCVVLLDLVSLLRSAWPCFSELSIWRAKWLYCQYFFCKLSPLCRVESVSQKIDQFPNLPLKTIGNPTSQDTTNRELFVTCTPKTHRPNLTPICSISCNRSFSSPPPVQTRRRTSSHARSNSSFPRRRPHPSQRAHPSTANGQVCRVTGLPAGQNGTG